MNLPWTAGLREALVPSLPDLAETALAMLIGGGVSLALVRPGRAAAADAGGSRPQG